MRYFIQINYNGLPYKGWQKQLHDISIQETIEKKFSTVFNEPIDIVGCGRTDAGVHAKNYVAHFNAQKDLPNNFLLRINKMLPKSISIGSIKKVRDEAHARFDAEFRSYKYFIHFNKDAFLQDRSYWIHSYQFDIDKMNAAAEKLLNYSDFKTFEKKGSDNKTTICTVKSAEWEILNENEWCFTICANRFLRNMVRRITGTLLMIGMNRLSIEEMELALSKHDILDVNVAPPAHGLFLWRIEYPSSIYFDEPA